MAYGKSKLTRPQVVRLEVVPPSKDVADLLRRTMERLRVVANVTVRQWLMYHETQGTLAKMSAKEPVSPCPPDFCRTVYRETQDAASDVQCATVLASQKWLVQTIAVQKSPRANEKRWRRVLRCDESHWSFNDPLPIRLWNGNAKVVRCGDDVQVVARLDRVTVPGRKTAISHPVALTLLRPSAGKRSEDFRRDYAAACEVADGVRDLSQSQLFFERGKLFLMMSVEGPAPDEKAMRDKRQVLVVRPGRYDCLRFRFGAKRGGFGDVLDRLSAARKACDEGWDRWRRHNPDMPVPAGVKLHLSAKWRNHCAAACDLLVTEVVAACRNRAIGRVLWFDGNHRTAALALAAKSGEDDRREFFPFELMRRKAEKRLGELGIEVVERANMRSVKRRAYRRKAIASGGVATK